MSLRPLPVLFGFLCVGVVSCKPGKTVETDLPKVAGGAVGTVVITAPVPLSAAPLVLSATIELEATVHNLDDRVVSLVFEIGGSPLSSPAATLDGKIYQQTWDSVVEPPAGGLPESLYANMSLVAVATRSSGEPSRSAPLIFTLDNRVDRDNDLSVHDERTHAPDCIDDQGALCATYADLFPDCETNPPSVTPAEIQPGAEDGSTVASCDGVDNDCDGSIDEDCPCVVGETRVCNNNLGICVSGRQECNPDGWGPCMENGNPTVELHPLVGELPELCDCGAGTELTTPGESCTLASGDSALDQDCDGDPFLLPESECTVVGETGRCADGRLVCRTQASGNDTLVTLTCESEGQLVDDGGFPYELCNGIDDDCDSLVDEHLGDVGNDDDSPMANRPPCQSPQPSINGLVGACSGARRRCYEGSLIEPCTYAGGEYGPRYAPVEDDGSGNGCLRLGTQGNQCCDLIDNDCDGATDEVSRACWEYSYSYRNIGECRDGIEACVAGDWSGICLGQVAPSVNRLCEGPDVDCDGEPGTHPIRVSCPNASDLWYDCYSGVWNCCCTGCFSVNGACE